MRIRIDAQISPAIAKWITRSFEVTATPLRDLGLRDARDSEIFCEARSASSSRARKLWRLQMIDRRTTAGE
ncbi:MAG: hypothetical protein GW893_16160 [Armatimonadetes bacterium]|nr:hypothetical protein [Armatimonadota bacterium]PIU64601.1 MAG: hypothetical protein COS85_11950 [Armatimonadetes bacterium CG07_land_8_20_14_0_80_59_28]PIX42787.1 MAG: hypothetical protein COZ56_08555 [Armatimonadetes bacterium CG_4_8_14_3_um_filter_58_9]PIY43614.1 MAG: hypothetical protein COZ05_10500 [Armatimonadetes bacterium CG_4_10_14_3_um_filter_59_10]PJB71454.1 MAG: hypothetical protein CO095_08060 [Armatimonadetes bacterium CG_4_9_14_3_um_filter_58_7]